MPPSNDFPALYHAHHNRQLEDLPFWLHLAKRYGSPILELGCGTGRISSPLSKAGYSIVGIDNDLAMLAYLLRNWAEREMPDLIQAEMTVFGLAAVFHLVILPCNTYSTLKAPQRRQTLTCIRRCLQTGGAFAVSMPNPNLLKLLSKESAAEVEDVFPHPTDGEPVQVSSAWKRTSETFSLTWYYDHLLPDGQVERTTARTGHSLEDEDVFIQELRRAGFNEIKVYGDFDESHFDIDSPNLILVAEL